MDEIHLLNDILITIRREVYGNEHIRIYYCELKQIQRALLWPAVWLKGKNISISDSKYVSILNDIIRYIIKNYDIEVNNRYFPAVLKKTIQSHYDRNGDKLYYQQKKLNPAKIIAKIEHNTYQNMASAYQDLKPVRRKIDSKEDKRQLTLF